MFEFDFTGIGGGEFSFGFVLDTDNIGDSGLIGSAGLSVGANVGFGIGVVYSSGELEGCSVGFDINAGPTSIQSVVSLSDGTPYYGGSLGLGIGGSLNLSMTETLSFREMSAMGLGNRGRIWDH